jgi:ATP-binding cassette subfamily C protein
MPLYLIICFGFHPWIGITALVGALILVSLTLATELLTREASKVAMQAALVRNGISDAGRRNAEVVQAMGMTRRLDDQWTKANAQYITFQRRTSDVAGGLGAASKILRMLLQSAVLAVGAYLVIEGKATGGIMIAGSILVSRALAPVELAIANWKGFVGARQGWGRLTEILEAMDSEPDRMRLPAPVAELSAEAASAGAPGGRVFLIHEVRFKLTAGSGVGIIGPSGSGKSSLAKMLVGVWPTWRGKIRLDGAALEQWHSDELGRHVGYLPQDVELFGGTVEQNIARFDPDAEPNAVIAAAKAADVHDLILRLPDGYKTDIGNGGATLSAGQRQRIALARALYSDPFLVVLDEPNSNLDSEGERALTFAIQGVRARGGIVVVIAHRPSALEAVDQVLVMREGYVEAFGQKDEVLNKVFRLAPGASDAPSRTSPNAPLKVVQA